MNVMPIDDFFKRNVSLSCLTAWKYTPKTFHRRVENRYCNSLLYIADGEYRYTDISKPFAAGKGSLIYIPYGAFHTYEISLLPALSVQIDFDLYCDGIKYAFSDEAFIVAESVNERMYEIINEIIEIHNFNNVKHKLKTASIIYELLSELTDSFPNNREYSPLLKKIEPALDYIENHYNEKFSMCDLCRQCLMSEAQLRRLFRKIVGVSPVEYKTKLRIKKACDMLISNNFCIAEISDILGFDNVYYFNKVFKKSMGISPGMYRTKHLREYENK